MVRSGSIRTLEPLKERVAACLQGGALAAGCEVELEWSGVVYADMLDNEVMVGCYAANSAALGRPVTEPDHRQGVVGSTDMGNVSHLVPSIHPMVKVSPPEVSIHSTEFARWAAGPEGDRAVLDGAKALAMTVLDLWIRAGARAEVRAAFEGWAATARST
jgi:metal-dependent amidase/aminoacylase/carboxypeptidase family protein